MFVFSGAPISTTFNQARKRILSELLCYCVPGGLSLRLISKRHRSTYLCLLWYTSCGRLTYVEPSLFDILEYFAIREPRSIRDGNARLVPSYPVLYQVYTFCLCNKDALMIHHDCIKTSYLLLFIIKSSQTQLN